MASKEVITAKYIQFIATEVIQKFGGSYQTYQTIGRVWRQRMDYNQQVENFIIDRTRVFLRLLNECDRGNINLMYKVCGNIAEYLSKYMVKKSPDLLRKDVTNALLHKFFLDSSLFIEKFKKAYKRPIDLQNIKYVQTNPGVVAMYKAINAKQY